MKNLIALITFIVISAPSFSFAWKETSAPHKDYNFKFKFQGSEYKVSHTAGSYDEAFVVAAQDCFNHFTETSGNQKVPESVGIAVIDSCANPKM
ncbi:MAG: hypothetical protein AB7O96_10445 [Pseudobdellovibrionaceae bacterium]